MLSDCSGVFFPLSGDEIKFCLSKTSSVPSFTGFTYQEWRNSWMSGFGFVFFKIPTSFFLVFQDG